MTDHEPHPPLGAERRAHVMAALSRAGRITIDDAWEPTGRDGETSVHLLIAGDVELGVGFARIVPLEGASPVRVSWDPAVPARLVERDLDDPVLSTVWGTRLTRIDLLAADRHSLSVTVELDNTTGEEPR